VIGYVCINCILIVGRITTRICKVLGVSMDQTRFSSECFCYVREMICTFTRQRCLDRFEVVRKGYNKSPTAGTVLGIKRSPEYIAKMAAAKRGLRRSPESLAKLRKTLSQPELKARIAAGVSAALRGKPKSPEHVRNAALALVGKTVTQETRAKLRAANLGKINGPHTIETRLKISLAQKGRLLSAEHRAKLAIAQQKRFARERAERGIVA